jgi:hypothetical protein
MRITDKTDHKWKSNLTIPDDLYLWKNLGKKQNKKIKMIRYMRLICKKP